MTLQRSDWEPMDSKRNLINWEWTKRGSQEIILSVGDLQALSELSQKLAHFDIGSVWNETRSHLAFVKPFVGMIFLKVRLRQRIIIAGTTNQARPLTVKKMTVPTAIIHGWEKTDSKSAEIIEDSIPGRF